MAFLGSKRRGSDCLILFISLKAWDYNLKYLFLKKDASQKKKMQVIHVLSETESRQKLNI